MTNGTELETRLASWRAHVGQTAAIPGAELDERERALSAEFAAFRETGLEMERWQTGFLPVYAGWAAVVVVMFPPLFGYL